MIEPQPITIPAPGPGQVLVRHQAVGVNFIDVYHRTGLYPQPLPAPLGVEAAGTVEAVGDGVEEVRVGDRVGYVSRSTGAYASAALVPASQLLPLPQGISSEIAAATLLKGLTAEALIFRCARMEAGQSALVHAAAGGVGQILVQWLSAIGVTVIAHAGSADKASKAKAAGAHLALHCPFDVLADEVRSATDGQGVHACFDGVGAASWAASLASMRKRGIIMSYGNASGPVPPVAPLELARGGSLFLTRPTLFDYIETVDERRAAAARLFDALSSGKLRIEIGGRYALSDAAKAHDALEARQTTGSTLLIP